MCLLQMTFEQKHKTSHRNMKCKKTPATGSYKMYNLIQYVGPCFIGQPLF